MGDERFPPSVRRPEIDSRDTRRSAAANSHIKMAARIHRQLRLLNITADFRRHRLFDWRGNLGPIVSIQVSYADTAILVLDRSALVHLIREVLAPERIRFLPRDHRLSPGGHDQGRAYGERIAARHAPHRLFPLARVYLVGSGIVRVPREPELAPAVSHGGHPAVALALTHDFFFAPGLPIPQLQQDDGASRAKALPDQCDVALAISCHSRPDVVAF